MAADELPDNKVTPLADDLTVSPDPSDAIPKELEAQVLRVHAAMQNEKDPKGRGYAEIYYEAFDKINIVSPYRAIQTVHVDLQGAIIEKLTQGTSVIVEGLWRTGKTSLTQCIARHLVGYQHLYIDIGGLGDNNHPNHTFAQFKANFCDEVIADFIAGQESKPFNENLVGVIHKQISESGKNPFQYLNDYLVSKNKTLFLVLDELALISNTEESEAKLSYIASIKNLSNIRLTLISKSSSAKPELHEKCFDDFAKFQVPVLTLEEVNQVIHEAFEGTTLSIDQQVITAIYKLSGGRICEINTIMIELFTFASETMPDKTIFALADIEFFIENLLKRINSGQISARRTLSIPQIIKNYQHIYENALNSYDQVLAKKVAEAGSIPCAEIEPSSVAFLHQNGWIKKDETAKTYSINGELLREALRFYIAPPHATTSS